MIAIITSSASSSSRRAAAATALFAACGAASLLRGPALEAVALPLAVSYAVLLLNTFHSIRCFAPLAARGGRSQRAIDAILCLAYIALAASLGDAIRFLFVAALLFGAATLKYAELMRHGAVHATLLRKLWIDAVGTLACIGALGIALAGHPLHAAWSMAVLNLVANAYLLWWRPLYPAIGATAEGTVNDLG